MMTSHIEAALNETIQRKKIAADTLTEAAETYREKNKIYADNFERVAQQMVAMFPDGLTVKTAHDWSRLHFLLLAQIKLSRYATNWENGGHQDSIRDATVYCAMLETEDKNNG